MSAFAAVSAAYYTPLQQARLAAACVGIAGAGGLGSNIAHALVRAGITRLVLADFDDVVSANLNRQFFFAAQAGEPKVEALATNLRRINPDLDLTLHRCRIEAGNARTLYAGCTVLVEAFDGAASKAMLVEAMHGSVSLLVAGSGLAGCGNSDAITVRRLRGLTVVGDGCSDVAVAPPLAPRVMVAAAKMADEVLAHILNTEAHT